MLEDQHRCFKEHEWGVLDQKFEQFEKDQKKLLDAMYGKNGDPGVIDDIRVIRNRNKNLYDILFKPLLTTLIGGLIMWFLMKAGLGH